MLKQPQYQPLAVEQQVAIIFAATNGYLDEVPVERVRQYEEDLFRVLASRHPGVLTTIAEKKVLDDDIRKSLDAAVKEFSQQFAATAAAA
jgi:F-type H+-transporting ATPase subunit alpha